MDQRRITLFKQSEIKVIKARLDYLELSFFVVTYTFVVALHCWLFGGESVRSSALVTYAESTQRDTAMLSGTSHNVECDVKAHRHT